jgi:hypothetical protein
LLRFVVDQAIATYRFMGGIEQRFERRFVDYAIGNM